VERLTITNCSQAVFVTDSARELYAGRYQSVPSSRFTVIANGYDEEAFAGLVAPQDRKEPTVRTRPMLLVHSGLLEQSDRDPTPFLEAIAALRDKGIIKPGEIKVILRDSGSDEIYQPTIDRCGLGGMVYLERRVSYGEALSEMLAADGLLIFQGSDCNRQIPAKIYEYIRAQRPILAMTDPAGETARLLTGMGIGTIARLNDKQEIERQLASFLESLKSGVASVPSDEEVVRHSRQWKARELAALLDNLAKNSSPD
jgi:hypothetical protein